MSGDSRIFKREQSPRLTSPAPSLAERPQQSTLKHAMSPKHSPSFSKHKTVEDEQDNMPRYQSPASESIHPLRHGPVDPRTDTEAGSARGLDQVGKSNGIPAASSRHSPNEKRPLPRAFLKEYEIVQRRLLEQYIIKLSNDNEEKDKLISQHDDYLLDLAEKYRREKDASAKKDAVILQQENHKSQLENKVKKIESYVKGIGNDYNYLREEASKIHDGRQQLSNMVQEREVEAQESIARHMQQIDSLKKNIKAMKEERANGQYISSRQNLANNALMQSLETLFNNLKIQSTERYDDVYAIWYNRKMKLTRSR